MRPGFEGALRQYGEVIKDIRKTEKGEHVASDVELYDLETVANYYVSKRSAELGVRRETQGHIFDLQKEKQMVIERLKVRLRHIDDPTAPEVEQPKDSMVARYDQERNVYVVRDARGRKHEVTFGEMIADAVWGLSYRLGEDAPRVHRKEYVVAQTKRSLMYYLDMQICLEERERKDHVENISGGAYYPFLQRLEGMEFPELVMSGWWAEEMVCGFLTRLAVDDIADIQVCKADVYQDINNTMDFSICRRDYLRGVDTQISEKGIGIQFTLVHNEMGLKKKRKKVERAKKRLKEVHLDDLILVSIPVTNEIITSMRQWKQEGCPPGGPMRFWSPETKEAIIDGVLQNLFSPEEIMCIQESLGVSSREKRSATTKNKKEIKKSHTLDVYRYLPEEFQSDEALLERALNILKIIRSSSALKNDRKKMEETRVNAMASLIRRYRTEKGEQKDK